MLSHSRSVTPSGEEVCSAQLHDSTITQLYQHLSASRRGQGQSTLTQPEMCRYRQFWSQLEIADEVVCRFYPPHSTIDSVTILDLPISLRQEVLLQAHDAPSACHQGTVKTLHRLRQEVYWVGMAKDADYHCRELVID